MKYNPSWDELDRILSQPINTLQFGTKVKNCLNRPDISIVGDIVRKSEYELRKYRNLGPKCAREIVEKLQQIGLRLDMNVPAGIREREVVLKRSLRSFRPDWMIVENLRKVGIITIGDFLSKTKDEFVSILNNCEDNKNGDLISFYEHMTEYLSRRGL